ncbi:MAG: DUF2341 domain-containing protein [Verrucomicrobia bacterium]|nr:DUF2341 domain-containing protein [Verrucomicrobiota bacterium]
MNLKRILVVTAASVTMALSCLDAAAAVVTNSYTLTYDGLGVGSGNAIPDPYPGIAAATVTHSGVDQNIAVFEDVYFWGGLSPGNGYGNLTNVAKGPSGTPAVPPAYGVVSITPIYSNNFVRIISCDFASLDNGGGDASSLIVVRPYPAEIYPYLNTLPIAGDVTNSTHTHIDFFTNNPSTGGAPIEGPINTTLQIYWRSEGGRVAIDNVHFEIVGPPPSLTPQITVPPANMTVTEPAAASFSVTATGAAPLAYQWRRGGVNIGGATSSSYTLSPTSVAADNGAQFSVVVTNASGSVTSAVATLTVNAPGAFPANLVSYWSLDETSGTGFSDQIGVNNAACVAPTCPVPGAGRVNGGQVFNGTTTQVSAPAHPSMDFANTNSFSLEAWVNTDIAAEVAYLGRLESNYTMEYSIGHDATGRPWFFLRDSLGNTIADLIAPSAATFNQWHHVVGVMDAAAQQAHIYVDGALVNTRSTAGVFTGTFSSPTATLDMGWINLFGGFHFRGTLDELALYRRALGAGEILNHYTSGLAGIGIGTTNLPPQITVPPANVTVTAPAAASFSVTATGTAPLAYQWRRNGVNIGGATSSSYTLSPTSVAADNGAQFRVVVTNASGSVTSAVAVLTVLAPPSVGVAGSTACVTATNVATRTWPHTVGSGNNRVLIVGVALAGTGDSVSSVSYGGIALIPVTSIQSGNAVGIWQLVAPPVGTANVVATWTGSRDMSGWSGTFTNVDLTSPIRNSAVINGSSTAPSITLAASPGDLVVDTVSADGSALSLSAGAGQTLICQNTTGNRDNDCWGASSYEQGAASVTMSWTAGASKNWGIAAAVLKAMPVPPQADVATTVTGSSSVFALGNLTYTVSVTNLGPFTAANVVVSDTLPAGVTFVSASGGGANSNGVVRWTIPSLPYAATTNFTVTATAPLTGTLTNTVASTANTSDPSTANNDGTSAAARVVTTVINLPPVANNDNYSVLEDTVLTVPASGVLTNDTDAEGQTLIASSVGGPTHGTLTLNSNGGFTYTPNTNFNGADNFTYRANDGMTNSATATVSITVTPVNDAPTIALTNTAGWAYRKQITIDHTKVGGGSDLANFPALIRLAADTNLAASAQSSGNDLLFTSADGLTKLSHEIENYTPASGALVAWVKLPVLSATVDTVINLYYGNATATNQQNAPAVWSDGYAGVWHLNGTAADSSSNANNGTVSDATATAGLFGQALNFNGTTAYVSISNAASLQQTTALTLQGWARLRTFNTASDVDVILRKGDVNPNNFQLAVQNQAAYLVLDGGDSGTEGPHGTTTLASNTWYYVVGTWNGTTSAVYLNGAMEASAADSTPGTDTRALYLGGRIGADFSDGWIDEVRMSGVARSGGWITTEYNNQNSPGTFSSLGLQQASATAITLAGTNEDTPSSGTTANAILTNANWADADAGALKGIAITAQTGNGTWQYSTDGATWTAFGTVSAANALLLNSTTQVRYLPDSQNGETATFGFKAWDQTTGTASINSAPAYANPGTGGGVAAYSSQSVTVSMTITSVNDAPVANAQSVSTPEEIGKAITLTGSDAEGSPLTFSLVTNPTNGVLSGLNTNTGSVTYTPNTNFNGADSFTFRVNDGTTNSAVATVGITVTPMNDAPVANAQSVSTAEDTAKAITLTGSDLDNDPLTFSIVSSPTNGVLSGLNTNTGTVTYKPNTNFNGGADSFTFQVNDGTTNSAVATVSLTVTPVNDAPIANAQSVSTPEDTAKTITLTGSDVENSPLTYALVTSPAHGVISGLNPNTGTVTYTPNTNFNGADSFTFRVNDGTNNSTAATVSLTVTPVNDVPVANAQGVSTPEDAAKAITLTGSDVESSPLTFAIVSAPTNGMLSGLNTNSGTVTYTPNTNFNGADSFTFRVNDGTTNSAVATVSLTVTAVNDAPVANAQGVSTPEEIAKAITLTGSDAEGSPLTFSLVTNPANGLLSGLNTNTGSVTYTPNTNFNGADSFTFRVNDGTTTSAVATVSLTVTPVNDAPIANAQSFSTPEDTAKTITLTGSDVESSPLTFAIVSGPTNGVLSGLNTNSGTVNYTPNTNFNGADSFTFRVNDGTTNSTAATVSLTVTPVNDVPVANGQSLSTPEDTAKAITLTGSDVDNNPLTFSIVTGPANGVLSGLNPDTGSVTYTPNTNFNGAESFTFRVNDGTSNSVAATVNLTVTSVNDAPSLLGAYFLGLIAEDDTNSAGILVMNITAGAVTDSDAGALSGIAVVEADSSNGTWQYTLNGTTWLAIGNVSQSAARLLPADATTAMRFVPGANYNGTVYPFSFYAWDQTTGTAGGTGDASVSGGATAFSTNTVSTSLIVTPVNDAPVANSQSVSTAEDTAQSITLTGSDVESSPLTFSIVTGPTNGVLSGLNPNTGSVTYTPSNGYSGADNFTFRVNDGQTNSGLATVSITVMPVVADINTTVTGPASVFAGANFSYTVMVTNAGPSGATSVTVSDVLPAGATFVSATAGGNHNAGVVTWPAISTLASGAAMSFTVTVTPTSNGGAILTNFVASTAATSDPDLSNNNGTSAVARVVSTVYNRPTLTGQRLPGGAFQLQLTTAPNMTVAFQASTNLVDWQTLSVTNSGSGIISFMDYDAANYQNRFYRSVQ